MTSTKTLKKKKKKHDKKTETWERNLTETCLACGAEGGGGGGGAKRGVNSGRGRRGFVV